MREYTLASVVTLSAALWAAGARGLLGSRSLWLGLLSFAAMTVVADVLLTGFGVFKYDPQFNAGIRIGHMPVEDLAYALALYLVAAITWSWGEPDVR